MDDMYASAQSVALCWDRMDDMYASAQSVALCWDRMDDMYELTVENAHSMKQGYDSKQLGAAIKRGTQLVYVRANGDVGGQI